jgi:hypothetical protein
MLYSSRKEISVQSVRQQTNWSADKSLKNRRFSNTFSTPSTLINDIRISILQCTAVPWDEHDLFVPKKWPYSHSPSYTPVGLTHEK